jgi:AAHS family 4-hydroxybenzoate transporter-like MFS transporter
MIAEFTTARWRSLAVTFGVVCVSIGGILGGGAAATILPAFGWRWLFWCSGLATIAALVTLVWLLPESPGYLARQPSRRSELELLLQRLGDDMPSGTSRPVSMPPLSDLLSGDLARDTLGLSTAMLSGMFLVYLMFNWAPTMLAAQGFALRDTSLGLTWYNIGGTTGAIMAALAVMGLGSRVTLPTLAGLAVLMCAALAFMPSNTGSQGVLVMIGLTLLGLTGSAAQSAMFALGAYAFPLPLRGRGWG